MRVSVYSVFCRARVQTQDPYVYIYACMDMCGVYVKPNQ